jgi:hypothetical protein
VTGKVVRAKIGFGLCNRQRKLTAAYAANESFTKELARDVVGGPLEKGRQ